MSSQQVAIAQAEAHVDQLRVQANLERIQVSQASKEYVSCQPSTYPYFETMKYVQTIPFFGVGGGPYGLA